MTKTLIFPSGIPSDRPSAPADRPSERPTRPTLPPPEDPSDESLGALDSSIEISERDFVDDDVVVDSGVKASTLKPPANDPEPPARRSWLLPALRIAAAALLLLTAIVLLLDPSPPITSAREPRIVWPERTALGAPASDPPPRPAAHGCVATAPPRFVAPRALVNPGLDVSSTATGFVVAFASAADEASAIRLEGTTLRAAENVRVRANAAASAPIRRVVARDADADDVPASIALRADTDDGRSVLPEGDAPAFRIAVTGTYVIARTHDRTHSLWSLPLPPKDRRIDALRVAPRDDGGAVVVVKRGSTFFLGFVNGAYSATGPLQIITRPGATLGTPFVVANGGGAALAWAERPVGTREWSVMVASMGGGEMETKLVAAGMSPSLGVFPDGTLAVAYADGPAAAHRIVVRRLAADLTPTNDPVVASSDGLNAGQPVVEIRPDGRALVSWLAVARGQPPSVYATPLACDVSP